MEKPKVCIVIGGSHAAAQLVSKLRPNGWYGKIIMISSDSSYPYHRPPLSKSFLSGEKDENDLLIRSPKFYNDNNIEVILKTTVTKINRIEKTIIFGTGKSISYDKLAICTGASLRMLEIQGCELENIFYLRDLNDSLSIRDAVSFKKKAVVVGGGYIGLETAASLSKLGLQVTLIEAQDRILKRTSSSETSEYIASKFKEMGVAIITGELVSSFEGNKKVKALYCQSGNKYEADLIIIGIGVIPNVQLAKDAQLEINDGILVNEYALTNDNDIVAAGDCTNHPNSLLGVNHRLESVPNANDQASTAAASICGRFLEYKSLPWFWSDQFDMKLQIAGISEGYDETVSNKTDKGLSVWYFKQGRLLAIDTINDPISFMVAKQLLTKRNKISPNIVKNNISNIRELLKINSDKTHEI